ncbi:EAL domain-containing protein [Cohnella sp. CFH 77786]|uniref:EAL domain-containing protein n=1 Tax=Cohnella sp. CFH 77786 TaxID=2662265 RepID=UPI001C60EEC2|nr:EAL domain-containing protein [Cohnella sp. CFH 77786]MBW5449106.1 EAL domain-containing protein [Cohnella sp. CFH 77786]
MNMSSQESGGAETFGGFPFRDPREGQQKAGPIGLIGLDLSEIGIERIAVPESQESELWNAWLARILPGESVRFGDRIGSHLWMIADIPDSWIGSSERYAEGLARRIRELMQAETEAFFGSHSVAGTGRDHMGYGAAVVTGSLGRTYKEQLYEAFLAAASRLHGWGRTETDTKQGIEMERILRDGDIRSAYQPLFHLRGGCLFGYEALTRCPPGSPFEGPLPLFRFAEREGYAFALDRLAREKAIRSCPSLGTEQKIFINVNSGIMKDPHFVSGQTRQWLAARGLKPEQVVLELTERDSIDDFEEAKMMLDHYRNQGYKIAIDDAGAGYSSLQAIVELKPDFIKLDKSLVQNADRDEMKLQMLRTFVRFAKRMKILTVAEGIETPEELHLVRKMGIDYGQGYLIGRPSEKPVLTYPYGIG